MNNKKWPWDRVYIINLDIMKYRYNNLVKMLEKEKITKNVKRISAVHGIKVLPYGKEIESTDDTNLKWKYIEKMNEILKKKNLIHLKMGIKYPYLKPGQIGHLLSFIKTLKHAQKYNYKSILILEDDAVIVNNFKEKFKKIFPYIPKDWDLLYLGVNNWHLDHEKPININKYICKLKGIRLKYKKKASNYRKMRYNTYNGGIWGTHALLMNRKCIDIFLDKVSPLTIPSDILLGRLSTYYNLINAYYICDQLINESSTIENISTTDNI
jgi:GR25 family glycosyltransferase involved in LPS biosynthesis